MTCRLAIFGATGDLTARYLLPGLAALHAAGHLGDDFVLAGASREEWDSGEFQRWASTPGTFRPRPGRRSCRHRATTGPM